MINDAFSRLLIFDNFNLGYNSSFSRYCMPSLARHAVTIYCACSLTLLGQIPRAVQTKK